MNILNSQHFHSFLFSFFFLQTNSPQWSLCQKSALVYENFYDFTGETFTRVRFDFIVQRKSTFYIINLIFPCATLSLIQLLVFVIPSTDSTSDRVGFGTTNLLTLVVFQTIVTEEMVSVFLMLPLRFNELYPPTSLVCSRNQAML